MNVYIDGLGNSEDPSTQVAMRVVKSASLMMGCKLENFGTSPLEAADFLGQYFGAVIEKHGPQSLNEIDKIFRALIQYEDHYLPQRSNDWPSSEQLEDHFAAYQKDGKHGPLKAIEENQKRFR